MVQGLFQMRILFNKKGNPIKSGVITGAIGNFGHSYNETVQKIMGQQVSP